MYNIICLIDGKQSLMDLAYIIKEQKNLDTSPKILWELFVNELIPRSLITFKDNEFCPTLEKQQSPFRLVIFPMKTQLVISKFLSKITSLSIFLILIGLFFWMSLTINYSVHTDSTSYPNFFIIFLLVVLGMLIHELGHSTAAVRGGIRPGPIKLRFLLFFPVLSIDVNDGWVLNRKSRIELDLGGLGLQSGFGIFLICLSDLTQSPSLFIASSMTFSIVLLNIIPFPNFDGYWFLTDALGIPNLKQTALAMFWPIFSRKKNENKTWGSISKSIQLLLYSYALFTVLSIILVFFYLPQFILLFIPLIISLPYFIVQIKESFIQGRLVDLSYQITNVIFSLMLCIGFTMMMIKSLFYFKSKIEQRLSQRVVIQKKNNDLKKK
jgi:putative peptide zinc metalloprotease protein